MFKGEAHYRFLGLLACNLKSEVESLTQQSTCLFPGGIVSSSAPPPDLPGTADGVSLRGVVIGGGQRDSSILHDGGYGSDVTKASSIPNYGKSKLTTLEDIEAHWFSRASCFFSVSQMEQSLVRSIVL